MSTSRKQRQPGSWIRIHRGDNVAIGPGKADLLEYIRDTGSIAAAGRRMGMSYKRAWMLVETMNTCFREPLVTTRRGGSGKGGAELTPTGTTVLERYRHMQAAANRAIAEDLNALDQFLRPQPPSSSGD